MAQGDETTVFEPCVNAPDGRPFVKMTCALGGDAVFAVNMSPAVMTAFGLRAIQAAIEAERDAGFVKHLREVGLPEAVVGGMLMGMRDARDQFDADTGSMRKLSDEDTSYPTDLDGEPDAG